MRHLPLLGAIGIPSSIPNTAGVSPIRTFLFEAELISSSFDSTIFPVFFSKITSMEWRISSRNFIEVIFLHLNLTIKVFQL